MDNKSLRDKKNDITSQIKTLEMQLKNEDFKDKDNGRQLALDIIDLRTSLDEKARRTGKFAGLTRKDTNRQLLMGKVSTRQLESLSGLDLVLVDLSRVLIVALVLEFLDGVLTDLLISLTRSVIIGSHGHLPVRTRDVDNSLAASCDRTTFAPLCITPVKSADSAQ